MHEHAKPIVLLHEPFKLIRRGSTLQHGGEGDGRHRDRLLGPESPEVEPGFASGSPSMQESRLQTQNPGKMMAYSSRSAHPTEQMTRTQPPGIESLTVRACVSTRLPTPVL